MEKESNTSNHSGSERVSELRDDDFVEKHIPLHRKLVEAAYKWVLKSGGCGVAFKELNSLARNGEYPDVIGFSSWSRSVLIECKISRSDFFADSKKLFRQNPEMGMGCKRFYACPSGLLKVDDIKNGWGLIYINEKMRATVVHNPFNTYNLSTLFKKNINAEHELMYSALRRLHIRGRIDEIYEQLIKP